MKKLILALSILVTPLVFGQKIISIDESKVKIPVYSVKNSIVLGENKEKDIQVKAIVTYRGQSTDFSPNHDLFLTFFNGGEMNNTKTAFYLGAIFEIKSTKRVRAGIYQITYMNSNYEKETIEIDTIKVFKDDRNLKIGDFEDPYFKSEITVTKK